MTMQKFDPYINMDPGTMNPIQHGEVFVTEDGTETDLDLGHYERFIDENLDKNSNVTTGKIYWSVLQKERHGDFGGGTVQVIPHITNEIKSRFYRAKKQDEDRIAIIEVGGTVGAVSYTHLFPVPNMIPNPIIQKVGVPIQKSIRFFIMIFPAFLARVKPVSTIAKPACIKKTSAAPISTQIVFTAENSIINLPFSFLYRKSAGKSDFLAPLRSFIICKTEDIRYDI